MCNLLFFFLKKTSFSYIFFIYDIFITLHLVYLSLFFFLIFIFYDFFIFFPLHFLGKKCYFLFVTLRIFITSYLAYSYCHYFIICFIIFSFFIYTLKKVIIQRLQENVLQCSNCNIILFFYYVKNELEILWIFINTYDFYYILLYITIHFFIHNYIFTCCQKTC